jgi:hypothetical protein
LAELIKWGFSPDEFGQRIIPDEWYLKPVGLIYLGPTQFTANDQKCGVLGDTFGPFPTLERDQQLKELPSKV